MRRLIILSAVAIAGFAAATTIGLDSGSTASAAPVARPYKASATVTRVIDGDTVEVRLASGKTERVRILGIDTPEIRPRECYATEATAAARRLAQGKRVRLLGDRTQASRDSYKRLLAYVGLPGGADLGQKLVAGGFATVYVYNSRPFTRVQSYRTAQAGAKTKRIGLWASCGTITSPKPPVTTTPKPPPPPPTTTTNATTATTTTTGTTTTAPAPPPPAGCHASYPDFCIPPPPPDKNCSDFSQKNFTVRHDVPNPDPHRLDGNKDGKACES
jgi:micrococcal nuclease